MNPPLVAVSRKLWIPGGRGMLGSTLARRAADAGFDVLATGHDVDAADADAVAAFVALHRPTHVINCAAWTAVDLAETERAAAHRANARLPGVLGAAAATFGARVVHVSTDYVFDGRVPSPERALREDDPTAPASVYGTTKRDGERALLDATGGRGLVVRTSWLYGPGGKNFVTTMLKLMAERDELKVVADQRGRPTSTTTLADALLRLLDVDAGGIVHVADDAGPRGISWHDFAVAIRAGALARGLPVKAHTIHAIPTSAYPTPAVRPAWSVLDTGRYTQLTGTSLPSWDQTLGRYLDQIVASTTGPAAGR
jgi:dTDP-4-dehydrorhamnose reductase